MMFVKTEILQIFLRANLVKILNFNLNEPLVYSVSRGAALV